MIVFLLHGYSNGCYMYKSLIKKLIQSHLPIAINFRTGVSWEENVKLFREIIASYPKKQNKAIVAHDWGAYIMWKLYNELEEYNVKKLFVMSISNKIHPNYSFNPMRLYQLAIILTGYIHPTFSQTLQEYIVGKQNTEQTYFTYKSNYSYNLHFWFTYFTVGENIVDELNSNIEIKYITSFEDKVLGFVNESLLSEPIKYDGHYFYKEYTNDIDNEIICFLDN